MFSSARKFGKRATPDPKDLITDLKLRDVGANRLHTPCQIHTEPVVYRLAEPAPGADRERLPSHAMPVQGIDGRRVNLHQYLIVFGNGFLHLLERKHIG